MTRREVRSVSTGARVFPTPTRGAEKGCPELRIFVVLRRVELLFVRSM